MQRNLLTLTWNSFPPDSGRVGFHVTKVMMATRVLFAIEKKTQFFGEILQEFQSLQQTDTSNAELEVNVKHVRHLCL